MVHSKHTIVKSSQHHDEDDTTSPSEQAAAGSCTESPGKRLHRTAVSQRQLHQFLSTTSCARTDNPEGCIRAHGSVNSQVFSADRQTANRIGTGNWICGSSLSTLVTLRRDTLFPSSSLLQCSSIHTTNTLTADTQLSWFLIMLKNSSLKMDAMSISR